MALCIGFQDSRKKKKKKQIELWCTYFAKEEVSKLTKKKNVLLIYFILLCWQVFFFVDIFIIWFGKNTAQFQKNIWKHYLTHKWTMFGFLRIWIYLTAFCGIAA